MHAIAIVLMLAIGCQAKPDGAPKSACSSLTPQHSGISAQNSRHSYTVSAVKSNGNKVRVTISSMVGEEFQGFVMQARSRDGNRLIDGTFTTSPVSKTIDCFNGRRNTLTQVNPNQKKEVKTEWTPAESLNEDIIFKATVAKTYSLFYTNIDSEVIRIQSAGNPNPQVDRSNAGRMSENSMSMYEGCYVTKGCFALPSNCINRGDCEVILSFSKVADGIRFSLAGYLQQQQYMAMGLSHDASMGDDTVTECYRDGSNVRARMSYNGVKPNNGQTRELPRNSYSGSFTNGLSSCTWTSPFLTQAYGQTYDLGNKTYYALLAKGPTEIGRIGYHTARTPSSEPINFTALEAVEDAGASTSVKIHGLTDESTSLQYSPTVLLTDASTEAKPTEYPATWSEMPFVANVSMHDSFSHEATEKPEAASDSLRLSFNHVFLLSLFGLIFYASGGHFIGM